MVALFSGTIKNMNTALSVKEHSSMNARAKACTLITVSFVLQVETFLEWEEKAGRFHAPAFKFYSLIGSIRIPFGGLFCVSTGSTVSLTIFSGESIVSVATYFMRICPCILLGTTTAIKLHP